MISRFVDSRNLTAQSLEPASDSVSPSLSKINKHENNNNNVPLPHIDYPANGDVCSKMFPLFDLEKRHRMTLK